jgi:hypothetical protein
MFNINDILNKSDLISYVERASGGQLTKTGGRYSCSCPLHNGDNQTAFSVYFEGGRWKWHCFSRDCGSGDAISFVEAWQYPNEPDKRQRFKLACEWISNGTIGDTAAMYASAEERARAAIVEAEAAEQRKQARIRELQSEDRHLQYKNNLREWSIEKWNQAGLDEGMQDFFTLGSCDDFSYWIGDMEYHTPTLTIPYFDEKMAVQQIQHRLVNPKQPKDKYRPDRTGIPTPIYLTIPAMGFDGGMIVVVEGAKKAMVTWSRLNEIDFQVIGVPTQNDYVYLKELLKGKSPIVIPDPRGNTRNEKVLQKPYDLARETNGTVLHLSEKVDDYLIETGLSSDKFYNLLKQSRKV